MTVAAKPERLLPLEIAHHDAEDIPSPNRELVDADHRRRDRPGVRELLPHVELVHLLDGVPIEPEIGRHFLDRRAAALLPDVEREAFRVVRVRCELVEPLLPHVAAGPARHAAHGDLEEDAQVATREIPHPPHAVIVPGAVDRAARAARRFFARRLRAMTRAWSSPGTAPTKRLGTNPGKRYASRSSRGESEVRMQRTSTPSTSVRNPRFSSENRAHATSKLLDFTHTIPRRAVIGYWSWLLVM